MTAPADREWNLITQAGLPAQDEANLVNFDSLVYPYVPHHISVHIQSIKYTVAILHPTREFNYLSGTYGKSLTTQDEANLVHYDSLVCELRIHIRKLLQY